RTSAAGADIVPGPIVPVHAVVPDRPHVLAVFIEHEPFAAAIDVGAAPRVVYLLALDRGALDILALGPGERSVQCGDLRLAILLLSPALRFLGLQPRLTDGQAIFGQD